MTASPRLLTVTLTCGILSVLATCAVVIRLWTRARLQKAIGLDDWMIVIATVPMWCCFVGVVCAGVIFHMDLHLAQLTVQQRVSAYWFLLVAEASYFTNNLFTKLAILLFYRRFAGVKQSKTFTNILNFAFFEVIVTKISYVMIIFLICRPFKALWERQDPVWAASHAYSCGSARLNTVCISAITAVEDLAIAAIPSLILWNLQIPLRQKFAVWLLFALSIGCGIVSLVRTKYLFDAFWGSADWVYNCYTAWMLTGIEIAIGVTCSSAPALKPFWTHFRLSARFKQLFGTSALRTGWKLTGKHSCKSQPSDLGGPPIHLSNPGFRSYTPKLSRPGLQRDAIFDGSMYGDVPTTSSFVTTKTTIGVPKSFTPRVAEDCSSQVGSILEIPESESSGPDYLKDGLSLNPLLMNRMYISVRRSIVVEDEEDDPGKEKFGAHGSP